MQQEPRVTDFQRRAAGAAGGVAALGFYFGRGRVGSLQPEKRADGA
jgi:hypothetical protein